MKHVLLRQKTKQQTTHKTLNPKNIIPIALCIVSISALNMTVLLAKSSEVNNLPGLGLQPNEVFFTGKPYSEHAGGYLFKYRTYDPELNRWTTPDPSGFPDGANNHLYGNNPLTGYDALGLQWGVWDFIYHFYFGSGGVSLSEIGYSGSLEAEAENQGIIGRFGDQIHAAATEIDKPYNGSFSHSFENSYDFSAVHFVFGSGTLSGNFSGTLSSLPYEDQPGGVWHFSGHANFAFSDTFSDPLSILQSQYGTSNPENVPSWFVNAANLGGTPYSISGSWTHPYDGDGVYE